METRTNQEVLETKKSESLNKPFSFDGVSELQKNISSMMKPVTESLGKISLDLAKAFEPVKPILKAYVTFEKELEDEWEKFNEEMKSENRYFPQSTFMDIFSEIAKSDTVYSKIEAGTELFRARIVENTFEAPLIDEGNPFKGYNVYDSDAPPSNVASNGRNNPQGISYLYTAEEIKTAIFEVQPSINQKVSVAKIIVKENLKIFDFEDILNGNPLEKYPGDEFAEAVGLPIIYIMLFFLLSQKNSLHLQKEIKVFIMQCNI